ncbi:MAG: hypothetical protein FWC50_12665 [Planctomycetaceae bacterium]|nr:hypothetical protein [Planctomycetaceae bacterium]
MRSILLFGLFCLSVPFAFAEETANQSGKASPVTNGVYAGIDALGRTLPMTGEVPPLRGDRTVCLFYFLWQGQHGTAGPYNISKIVAEHPEAIFDAEHPAWGPVHAFHHWGEALFGYYTSDDTWVLRKHVQILTDAGIDFLIVDATNGSGYTTQALKLMAILDEYQKQGWNVPKIAFYTNSASGQTINQLYQAIYKKNLYPNVWFHWEGKPLIVGHPEECNDEIKHFFRIKKSQWPNEGKYHNDGFPWIAFERPQHVFKNANGENEIVNVSTAQHDGTIRFSSSAFYGDQSNHTKSFHNGKNDPEKDAVLYGYNFVEQFEFALKQDPKIIFITGWNEWIAMRFKNMAPNEPVGFVDLCDLNNNRDIEPMQDGYGDNYYMQMIDFVRQYKGVGPQQSGKKAIYRDYVNDTVDRDAAGYGTFHYTNKTGRNDIAEMQVTCDSSNICFEVKTVGPISPKTDPNWMTLFLNVDKPNGDMPNWEHYQFVINRVAPKENQAVLERSTGGWHWEQPATVDCNVDCIADGNQMRIIVPRKLLGFENKPVELQFKWADNYQPDNLFSFYTDGDAAPLGRLNYVFTE